MFFRMMFPVNFQDDFSNDVPVPVTNVVSMMFRVTFKMMLFFAGPKPNSTRGKRVKAL
jgi:hypothetical protein